MPQRIPSRNPRRTIIREPVKIDEVELIAKLKTTGVSASYLMCRYSITHTRAIEILQRLGARKSNTSIPTMWRLGVGTSAQDNWNGQAPKVMA